MSRCKEEMDQQNNKSKQLINKIHSDLTNSKDEMNQCVFAGPAMTDQEDLRYLIQQVRADLATCKAEMNRQVEELRVDLATSTEEMNQQINKSKQLINKLHSNLTNSKDEMTQRVFSGTSMTDQEDLQASIDRMHAERYSGSLGKDSHTDGISPYCYGWRRHFGTILWTLAILGLVFGCGWNLREILQDMMESPTLTKMTYTLHDELSLPSISVYQSGNAPMLHTEKLLKAMENGTLTKAYLEAIMKGVAIGFIYKRNRIDPPSEITEAYKEAILRYGSLTEAGLALYREYGITCDELFTNCVEEMFPALNCCDIFKFSWGLSGPQYALKWNTIFLDAIRGFSVGLRSLPNIESLLEGNFVEESGNYQSYLLSISNGDDQSGFDAHSIEVQPSEQVIVNLRQKRRNLKISKDCVDPPAKLRYFRDYTITSCFIERCYIDKLSLCNISCEIPLLQLMNPDNLSGPPCEFDVINSTCRDLLQNNHLQCSTNHGCRFPCNYTEVEYSVTKGLYSGNQREIELVFQYDTTEVQTFEETSRLTLWEYLSLISSILDLWLGITIFSLHRMLYGFLSKITYFKPYDLEKNSAAAHSRQR